MKSFKPTVLKMNFIAIQTDNFFLPGCGFNKHTGLTPELAKDNL